MWKRSWKFKKLQKIYQKIKYKLPKADSKMTLFLPTCNENMHADSSYSVEGFLDVWKDDWAIRITSKWFQL